MNSHKTILALKLSLLKKVFYEYGIIEIKDVPEYGQSWPSHESLDSYRSC